MVFLFLLFLNSSIADVHATGIAVIKYGYGKIYWGKKASTADPVVYPLDESSAYDDLIRKQPDATIANLYPYYEISEAESELQKKAYEIEVSLTVTQEDNDVLANVEFHNKSNKNYFIYKWGMPSIARDPVFGVMCGSSFLITMNNIKLDYLGHTCDFGDDMRDWWLKIKPGERFSYIIPLNRAYEFLPGKHQYQIGSLEYPIVTEQWFSEKKIYNVMFSIFDRRSLCPIKTDYPLVSKYRFLCPQYESGKNDLKHILNNIGFNGDGSGYYFEIRTNQVFILINANKNTSYYQFIKKIRQGTIK